MAIPKFYVSDLIDKEILDNFYKVVSILKQEGVEVEEVDMKYLDNAVCLYQVIALGEASTNLARFDGIKYGYSYDDAKNIEELYKKTRSEGFGAEVKRRMMIGSYLLSGPNAKIYYNKALKIRKCMSLEFSKVFNDYDLIIGPTTTSFPCKLDKLVDDANKSFMDDILTIPVNMAGLPGLSLPIYKGKNNLPIGMQIIGNRFDEKRVYQLASFIEKMINLRGENNE